MVITIEQEFATVLEESGIEITFEHAVPRDEFLTEFNGADFSETRQLSYEPARGLFHIIESNYSLTSLGSPADDERMSFIHENAANIVSWFKEKHDQENADLGMSE